MKKYFKTSKTLRQSALLLALFAVLTCFTHASMAQIHFGASINIQTYVPPPWAPPYDNVSSIRYYYLPDYDMYYEVWDGEFWYADPRGEWISSEGPPQQYAGIDLSGAFIVLIDRNISRPWTNYSYYRRNYPEHGYDHYRDIVARNRIVTNTAPGHELVPRAFNENSNRVTFMQRPVRKSPDPNDRAPNNHAPATYHRVAHEVPIKSIAPSMPPESRNFNYGRGYVKPPATPQSGTPRGGGVARGGPAGGNPKGGPAGGNPKGGPVGGNPKGGQGGKR